MRAVISALGLSLVLAACGGGSGDRGYAPEMDEAVYDVMPSPPPPPPPPPSPQRVQAEPAVDGPVNQGGESGVAGAAQFIAYSHSLGLRLPRAGVEPMLQAHLDACREAGPSNCIIIFSSMNNQSDEWASASLQLRARPEWIESFMGGLESELETASGEITYRNTSAEDLTRTIIDTDSRLNAQRTLQTRLETLLERRDGELSDLLAIERELARVTGEVESITSQLAALRLRVSMSELSVAYETRQSAVSPQRFNPLGEALGDFFWNLSSGLAGVITAFAVGLPWLILIGVFLFIWLRLIWPRIRRKKA